MTPREDMAEFWTSFIRDGKRLAFREALVDELANPKCKAYDLQPGDLLYSDYDPCPRLLLALHAAGIERRGCAFSSEDVGFPVKTGTQVDNGIVLVKRGYGSAWLPLDGPEDKARPTLDSLGSPVQ